MFEPPYPMTAYATIPIFPLNVAVLPGEFLPLHIFEPHYRELVALCLERKDARGASAFGVSLRTTEVESRGDSAARNPIAASPASVLGIEEIGCTVSIADVIHRFEDGRSLLLGVGERRYRVLETVSCAPFPLARVAFLDELPEEVDPLLKTEAIAAFRHLLDLGGFEVRFPPELDAHLSFQLAATLQLDAGERKELLEALSESKRLTRLLDYMHFRIATFELGTVPDEVLGEWHQGEKH
ncbi:MAG: LON peptidase substrate-binding domain-containing protein [Bdellovibrionales bacterium]|nr:LON peptidase substrate-binding domain-containing protein [Bdellovibrionales bacterium]